MAVSKVENKDKRNTGDLAEFFLPLLRMLVAYKATKY
ncbi:MAG: hypothetical protein ACI9LN_002774 [Saprospiraceae bacterium]|jgi:hypothetical protein